MATRTISALGGNWSATTAWVEAQVPTAADDVVASLLGLSGALVVTTTSVCRSADFTGYTNTLSGSGDLTVGASTSGAFKLAATMTNTWTGTLTFASTVTGNVITTAGIALASNVTFNGVGGSWTQGDAFLTTGTWTLTNGSYSDGGFNLTAASFASSNANTRVIVMGDCTWKATGTGTVWNFATTTGLTFTPTTSTIEISDISTTGKTFAGGGLTYETVHIDAGGSGLITISGANTFDELQIDAPKSVQFPASVTQTFIDAPQWRGSSGNVITITSSSAGTAATLLSNIDPRTACDWLSLKDSSATGTTIFDQGSNSTQVSGVTGWIASSAPVNVYPKQSISLGIFI